VKLCAFDLLIGIGVNSVLPAIPSTLLEIPDQDAGDCQAGNQGGRQHQVQAIGLDQPQPGGNGQGRRRRQSRRRFHASQGGAIGSNHGCLSLLAVSHHRGFKS
jgi:hypothetical protein